MHEDVVHRPSAVQHLDGASEPKPFESDSISTTFNKNGRSCVAVTSTSPGKLLRCVVPTFLGVR